MDGTRIWYPWEALLSTRNMNSLYIRNYRGQALVESVLIIPVLIAVVFSIVWFSRILITRQQLLSAARYGTDLIVYTQLNENDIRREIRNYLSHHWIEGRKLDAGQITDTDITVRIEKFTLPNFTMTDYLAPLAFSLKMKDVIAHLVSPLEHTSYVQISYEFALPSIFRIFHRRTLHISARSEVLAGTGCPGDIHQPNR